MIIQTGTSPSNSLDPYHYQTTNAHRRGSFGPPTQLFERADDAEMQIFQAFYKLQGQEGLDRDDVIHIPGLKKGIKPYQAFGAMYMLRCEKPLNGGFLADEMGLGKVCP